MIYIIAKLMDMFKLSAIRKSKISKKGWVGHSSNILGSEIDDYSYVGNYTQCTYANIGKFCSVGNNCTIGGAEHPIQFVSTSPVFYGGYRKPFAIRKLVLGNQKWDSYSKRTIIESDVWIGSNVIVKAGVKISSGAVIGAGSIVTKDVPPYEIWGGVPAKLIKKRFNDSICKELLKSEWWNMARAELEGYSDVMNNPELFLSLIKK